MNNCPRIQNSETVPEALSAFLSEVAIARLSAVGTMARRSSCMALPSPVFQQLCRQLLHRKTTVRGVAKWLLTAMKAAPTRSSVERFSHTLFAEYQAAARDYAQRGRV